MVPVELFERCLGREKAIESRLSPDLPENGRRWACWCCDGLLAQPVRNVLIPKDIADYFLIFRL